MPTGYLRQARKVYLAHRKRPVNRESFMFVTCEFVIYKGERLFVAEPVGLEGGTQGETMGGAAPGRPIG